jgi:hypothetical protein
MWLAYNSFFTSTLKRWQFIALPIATAAALGGHAANFLALSGLYGFVLLLWFFDRGRMHGKVKPFVLGQLPILMLYAPFLYVRRNIHYAHLRLPDWHDIFGTYAGFLCGDSVSSPTFIFLSRLSIAIVVILALWTIRQNKPLFFVIVAFMVLPPLTMSAISVFLHPMYRHSPLIYTGFPLVILTAQGLFQGRFNSAIILKSAFAVVVVLAIYGLIYQYQYTRRQDFRGAAQFVRSQFRPATDLVVTTGDRDLWAFNWYFLNKDYPHRPYNGWRVFADKDTSIAFGGVYSAPDSTIRRLLAKKQRIFFVKSNGYDEPGTMFQILGANGFEQKAHKILDQMEVFFCQRDSTY